MQKDFHYYATYAAAYIAGYSHEESLAVAYSAQFVDDCSMTLLSKIKGPLSAATTQLQLEMMDVRLDKIGLQDITRIWSSFHFLPYDLFAKQKRHASKAYMDKYRLLCNTNGALVADTVKLAKDKSLQAVGVAMHVLADTWAHRYFAGTPSLVINNTNYHFFEKIIDGSTHTERQLTFRHNPAAPDDVVTGTYTNTIYQPDEITIMNLGHGRAGHLPDYSFARYRYLPAWGNYEEIVKDNPSDYMHAFCQMICAMKFLRGEEEDFKLHRYDWNAVREHKDAIDGILNRRQLDACADWKAFDEKLSGCEIADYDVNAYQEEYRSATADEKDDTFLGRFILAALAQKSMVTNRIYKSGNMLAGVSVDYVQNGFRGIPDYKKLLAGIKKGAGL